MTPEQRAAAERLAEAPRTSGELWGRAVIAFLGADQSSSNLEWSRQVVALLRELLAEPVQEPVAWGVFVDDELFKPFNCKDEAVDWFQAQYNHGSRYDFLVLPLYTAPQQRKPLKTAMEAEIECDCLVAWNASTYGHSAHDTVHPMFLSAFIRGYRAAERAHGIGEPT